MSTNHKPTIGKRGKTTRAQAPFRLSEDVMTFLNDVADIANQSNGLICEEALWDALPGLREKYTARKTLIAQNSTYPTDKLRHHKKR